MPRFKLRAVKQLSKGGKLRENARCLSREVHEGYPPPPAKIVAIPLHLRQTTGTSDCSAAGIGKTSPPFQNERMPASLSAGEVPPSAGRKSKPPA